MVDLVKQQRGHVARLELTPGQAAKLDAQAHAARALWNLLHEWWQCGGKHRRPTLKQADEAIRQARKDIDWLADLPAQAAQQVLKQYHRGWVNCWEGRAQAPRFKGRLRSRMSVDVPQGRDLDIKRLSHHWGEASVPKLGRVRFRWSKDLPGATRGGPAGRVTGARLAKDPFGWSIVFRTETHVGTPKPHDGPLVGIDRGIAVPLALSDATFREHGPWLTDGEREHVRRLEKKSARQRRTHAKGQPVGNRLSRTYDQIARLHAIAKRRAVDWQHQTTTEIAEKFGVVGVEDLQIKNMLKSAKGTIEAPGRNVRQKSGLNRAIAGEAWGRTVELLAYKTLDRGGMLVKVPAPYTSLRCHRCGFLGIRPSQALFACTEATCGWVGNADYNAACNIGHAARRIVRDLKLETPQGMRCQDVEPSPLGGAVKRQPPSRHVA